MTTYTLLRCQTRSKHLLIPFFTQLKERGFLMRFPTYIYIGTDWPPRNPHFHGKNSRAALESRPRVAAAEIASQFHHFDYNAV